MSGDDFLLCVFVFCFLKEVWDIYVGSMKALSLGFLFVYKLCLGEVCFFFFSFPLPLPYHLSSSSYPNSLIGKLRRKTNTSPTVTEGAVKETSGQWFCGGGGFLSFAQS